MLSRGDGTRPIPPEAEKYIVHSVATDVLGAARAAGMEIELDEGTLTLRDVWDALENRCGPHGWAALVRRGES